MRVDDQQDVAQPGENAGDFLVPPGVLAGSAKEGGLIAAAGV
jgi:hypothetical protein